MAPSRSRRTILRAACAALALSSMAAQAQNGKPIEWVVGFAAGGGSDVVARTVAEAMAKELGQTIVVSNKPGAATNIAADYVVKSRDVSGQTLLTADFATLATNPFLYSRLTYQADKDLELVGMLVRFPLILVVGKDVPARNLKEFIAWAKGQNAPVNYGSPGTGTPHHLATELLGQKLGLSFAHVPYRGAAPAIQDVIGNQVPFMIVESAGGLPHISSGRLKPIAVASRTRMPTLPDVPTLQEQGVKDFEAYAWQGVAVPHGTPQPVVDRLNKALVSALNATPVKARFQTLGTEPLPGTAAEMARFARSERDRWGPLIQQLGLKAD